MGKLVSQILTHIPLVSGGIPQFFLTSDLYWLSFSGKLAEAVEVVEIQTLR